MVCDRLRVLAGGFTGPNRAIRLMLVKTQRVLIGDVVHVNVYITTHNNWVL
jgi:hypothetical protein